MVLDLEPCIGGWAEATGVGSIGRANDDRTKLVFFPKVFLIEFVLDDHQNFGAKRFRLPDTQVEEDVVTKVFGFDKAKLSVRFDVFNFANTPALNEVLVWLHELSL